MKQTILFFILISSLSSAQGSFRYGTYKMDDKKKSYNIDIGYGENKNFEHLILEVNSDDVLFDKSSFIIENINFPKFITYLNYVLSKQTEWDIINQKNKTKEVTKNINWDEKPLTIYYTYDGGQNGNTNLYTMYSFLNNNSLISIYIPDLKYVKGSQIYFANKKLSEAFLSKLDLTKIQNAINKDYDKKKELK